MSLDEKLETVQPDQDAGAIGLDSPARIVPAMNVLTQPPVLPPREVTPVALADSTSSLAPPVLPPRDVVAHVPELLLLLLPPLTVITRDDKPPELPARSPRSPRSVRSPKSVRNDNEKIQRNQLLLQRSLVYHDNAHYLVVNQASLMSRYKLFLNEQDLVKEQTADVIIGQLEIIGASIDFEFWKFFLLNYEDIPFTTDLTILTKIEAEFSNLSDPQLRRIAYLVLTHSDIFDDQLFNELQIDLSKDQESFIEKFGESSDLALLLSKFITVDGEIPNQFIIELARFAIGIPFFKVLDLFKLTTCFNFQFKRLVLLDKEKESNNIFIFQLARALEDSCPKVLLLLTKASALNDTLGSLRLLVTNSEFWIGFFKNVKENVILKLVDSFVLKGFETLIILIVKLMGRNQGNIVKVLATGDFTGFLEHCTSSSFFEPLNGLDFYLAKEPVHLYKYKKEFKMLVNSTEILYPERSNEKLSKASSTNEKLLLLKNRLEAEYNQILSNYQQLNEEKFTNETYFKPLLQKKVELVNQGRELLQEYEMKSQNVEILKINNERNEQIDKSNELLTENIRTLNEEVEELRQKLKMLREIKQKR